MEFSTVDERASNSTFSKKINSTGDFNGGEYRSDGNIDLHDSEFTVDSMVDEPGSGMGWFGGIGTDFLHCLTENVSPVVSGVATLVHKTAVAVANEISQLERDGELKAEAIAAEQDYGGGDKAEIDCKIVQSSSSFVSSTRKKSDNLILPWEICRELSQNPTVKGEDDEIPVYFTDTELMKKIFALSSDDSTFVQPFFDNSPDGNELQKRSISSYCSTFTMDEPRVKLIHRILDIDENLDSVHSRLTGGVPNALETFFWKNYFFHCERVRTDEFHRRKKHNQTAKTEISCQPVVANFTSCNPTKESVMMKSAENNDDDESLVPVGFDIEGEHDDESSYVIQSAPNTGDTFATSRSIDDDLVLVDAYEGKIR